MYMTQEEELERIEIRRQIKHIFTDAMNKLQQGDKKTLKTMLAFIHNEFKNGFSVLKGLPEGDAFVTEDNSYTHKDKTLIIKDKHMVLVAFYKCKIDGEMKMYFNENLLITNAEWQFMMREAVKHSKAVMVNGKIYRAK